MGHKRNQSNSVIDSAISEEEDDGDRELLRQSGLPSQFGTCRRQFEDDPTSPASILPDSKRRPRKPSFSPYLSDHAVISESCGVSELLSLYSRDLDPSQPFKNDEVRHLRFDDGGNPLPESSSSSLHQDGSSETAATKWRKKFYRQRYDLFHQFDQGVQIDDEGWFSVTPERIALHTAQSVYDRHGSGLVWDAFVGVGGNAIQFAISGMHVVATDNDEGRLRMAQHNAAVYQVDQYMDFILADVMDMNGFWRCDQKTFGFEAIFLSPPWGGPEYIKSPIFDPLTMLPIDLTRISHIANTLSKDVVYYLPKSTDIPRLKEILPSNASLLLEQHYLDERLKVLMIHAIVE